MLRKFFAYKIQCEFGPKSFGTFEKRTAPGLKGKSKKIKAFVFFKKYIRILG